MKNYFIRTVMALVLFTSMSTSFSAESIAMSFACRSNTVPAKYWVDINAYTNASGEYTVASYGVYEQEGILSLPVTLNYYEGSGVGRIFDYEGSTVTITVLPDLATNGGQFMGRISGQFPQSETVFKNEELQCSFPDGVMP